MVLVEGLFCRSPFEGRRNLQTNAFVDKMRIRRREGTCKHPTTRKQYKWAVSLHSVPKAELVIKGGVLQQSSGNWSAEDVSEPTTGNEYRHHGAIQMRVVLREDADEFRPQDRKASRKEAVHAREYHEGCQLARKTPNEEYCQSRADCRHGDAEPQVKPIGHAADKYESGDTGRIHESESHGARCGT